MRLFSVLAGFICTVLALPIAAQGTPESPSTPAETAESPAGAPAAPLQAPDSTPALNRADLEAWLDGFMPYALRRGDIAGAVVVVVKDGKVLLEKGYGYSDVAKRKPVDPETTLFRPGSVSKLFTWTAVMQQVEQGKIDLDADVNKYLDFEIPPLDGKPVTMRNIMTHTSGLEEVLRALIVSDPKELAPLGATVKSQVPSRIFAPGTMPSYSNYATALAGYIVERVSGQSFDDYLDKHVFAPLDMKHSSFRQPLPAALFPLVSMGYERGSDDKPKPYEFINMSPAGSLASTGTDMGRFMIAHLQSGAYGTGRILRADTATQMHTSAQTSIGPLNRMMLGFYETNVNGHRSISHGGDTQWFHSYLHLFPDDGVGLYVSMNSGGKDGAAHAVRGALFEEFANRYLQGPGPAGEGVDAKTAKLHAQQMLGNYESSRRRETGFMALAYLPGQAKVVINEDGTISVPALKGLNEVPKKWREISPYVWRDVAGGERIAAEVIDGKVTRFSTDPISPFMVFQRTTWSRSAAWIIPALIASLSALLLTVLAWPISAMVRKHYGLAYALKGADARAHRWVRIAATAVLVAMGAALFRIGSMLMNLELMVPGNDWIILVLRLLNLVVLPIGAAIATWSAWEVITSKRRVWAKLWSVVLAASCLFLLWLGIVFHVVGLNGTY